MAKSKIEYLLEIRSSKHRRQTMSIKRREEEQVSLTGNRTHRINKCYEEEKENVKRRKKKTKSNLSIWSIISSSIEAERFQIDQLIIARYVQIFVRIYTLKHWRRRRRRRKTSSNDLQNNWSLTVNISIETEKEPNRWSWWFHQDVILPMNLIWIE